MRVRKRPQTKNTAKCRQAGWRSVRSTTHLALGVLHNLQHLDQYPQLAPRQAREQRQALEQPAAPGHGEHSLSYSAHSSSAIGRHGLQRARQSVELVALAHTVGRGVGRSRYRRDSHPPTVPSGAHAAARMIIARRTASPSSALYESIVRMHAADLLDLDLY